MGNREGIYAKWPSHGQATLKAQPKPALGEDLADLARVRIYQEHLADPRNLFRDTRTVRHFDRPYLTREDMGTAYGNSSAASLIAFALVEDGKMERVVGIFDTTVTGKHHRATESDRRLALVPFQAANEHGLLPMFDKAIDVPVGEKVSLDPLTGVQDSGSVIFSGKQGAVVIDRGPQKKLEVWPPQEPEQHLGSLALAG